MSRGPRRRKGPVVTYTRDGLKVIHVDDGLWRVVDLWSGQAHEARTRKDALIAAREATAGS